MPRRRSSPPWLARRPISVTWPTTAIATAAATVLMAAVPGSAVLACAATALFGLSYTAASSVLILWASSAAGAGTSGAGTSGAGGTALLFIALVLGQAAGAFLAGVLLQVGDPASTFTLSGALCAVSGAAVTGMRRRTRPPARTNGAAVRR